MSYPEIYVLRHGETEWNVTGKFQGRQDSPLTARGRQHAQRQRELLQTLTTRPLTAFCSPQERARHTAQLALGGSMKPVFDDRLKEIDFGDWEGKTRLEIKTLIDCPFESHQWYFHSPKGESYADISKRVKAFLNDLVQPAVIVTHGVTSIVLRGLYLGLSKDALLQLPKEQGCIYHLSDGQERVLR
ncbi:histidine phosphatase family protein [Shimia sp. R10_1]|uniref:histidine phosphatase family protein n=1 Tax=Shimia sp. R10_1 TaxID=2821095 RepID=UPI001ADB3148|nr:histidine phosphatase family protein [Shimia sp. R10_1]MBO9472790.1 histidine phosphatase family protein [Shimia sp. R10_1]